MNVVTFTELRKNLKTIMDVVSDEHEPVIITRPRNDNMILMAQTEYDSLRETAYLLSSDANVKHLRRSLDNLKKGKVVKKSLKELLLEE